VLATSLQGHYFLDLYALKGHLIVDEVLQDIYPPGCKDLFRSQNVHIVANIGAVLVALPLQRGSCNKWVYNIARWGLIKLRVYFCRLMMFHLLHEGVHIPFYCAQDSRPMQQQLT
jgi:hypothetical protein